MGNDILGNSANGLGGKNDPVFSNTVGGTNPTSNTAGDISNLSVNMPATNQTADSDRSFF